MNRRTGSQASRQSLQKQNTRKQSALSVEDMEDMLAKTDNHKTSGTFFYTAGADAIQIMPEHKFDRRIIAMYQR